MAEFISTVDLLGDEVVADSIIDRSITEFRDAFVTSIKVNCFYNAFNLTLVDLASAVKIEINAFYSCRNLKTMIIRSEIVCEINNNLGISSKPIVYVRRVLVDAFKAHTHWQTLAGEIRALEDYTVDGTIYGDLDESKI